ncbi:MAG: hypothetical protein HY071_00960 [Chloroflexi bacterium]|nr:hypothetical protein [Chloroflexota bacterium]
MNGAGWLDGIFGTVQCANCGTAYAREDVAVVGNRENYWFVRCSCHSCGTQGIGVVIVREATAPPGDEPAEAALDVDDVLTAHEMLRDYAGDMHGLFERIPGSKGVF